MVFFDKKGQGATEYLIVVAIVIIISLIVVAALGGIPGIGGGAKTRATDSFWATNDLAITSHSVSATTSNMTVTLRNNMRNTVNTVGLEVNSVAAACANTKLKSGQETTCTVDTVTSCSSGDSYDFGVVLNYTDSKTSAVYSTTGDGQKLSGSCAT